MFKGVIIGILIAMPVGPVTFACLDQGVRKGFMAALWLGIGCSLIDGVFAAIAYMGDQTLGDWLTGHRTALALVAAALFLFLGLRMMFSRVDTSVKKGSPFLLGIVLTAANPLTILAFLALANLSHATWGWVAGVFVGSLFWWAVIAYFAYFLGKRISPKTLRISRWIGGLLICGLGVLLAIKGA